MDAVADQLYHDVRCFEDRQQGPGLPVVQRLHRVVQVSDMAEPGIERGPGFVVAGVRVAE